MPTFVSNHTAILSGSSWTGSVGKAARVLTYSFPTKPLWNIKDETGMSSSQLKTFEKLAAQYQSVVRSALNEWAKVSGLTFVEVSGSKGDLRFTGIDFDAVNKGQFTGYAYYPRVTESSNWPISNDITNGPVASSNVGGDVFLNTKQKSGWNKQLIMHEIGHAIGLKHTHEGDVQLKSSIDNTKNTVMSYNWISVNSVGHLDIDAVRSLYGRRDFDVAHNKSTNTVTIKATGNSDKVLGSSIKDKILGGKGNDSIYALQHNDLVRGGAGKDGVNGGGGHDKIYGNGGRDFLFGEDGKDKIFGGSDNDKLLGGLNNDLLRGGKGDDKLYGGADNDRLFGDGGKDIFVFDFSFGNDRIQDFQDGKDKLDFSAFFSAKSTALLYFSELGTTSDDKVQFDYAGGNIVIKGVDLKDIGGQDIIV